MGKEAEERKRLAAVMDSHRLFMEFLNTIPAEEFVKDGSVRAKGWKVTVASLMEAEAEDEAVHVRQLQEFRKTTAG
jgi:hypothetical protein